MSFLICRMTPLGEREMGIDEFRSLALGGASGVFARHLPHLTDEKGFWSLSAAELLRLENPEPSASAAIVFDLTPGSPKREVLYRLVEVRGRTVSLITDALFHFKVLCLMPSSQWSEGPDRYEQLRLEGGKLGGSWAWGESPTAVCATLF